MGKWKAVTVAVGLVGATFIADQYNPEIGEKLGQYLPGVDKPANATLPKIAAQPEEKQPVQVPGDPEVKKTTPDCTDISKLSPEAKAGQLIIALVSAKEVDKVGELAKYRIGSFALWGSLTEANKAAGAEPSDANAIGTRIKTSKAKLEKATKLPVSVALDEEGGRVQRTSGLKGAQTLPSARTQTKDMLQSKITDMHYRHGVFLRELGVTINFAPVADVGNGLGDRTYGTDVDSVVRNARVAMNGMMKAGISPTLKHFPGIGRINEDSHLKPVTTMPWDQLKLKETKAFKALIDGKVKYVMVSHGITEGLTDKDQPASRSPKAYSYLRNELGFKGVIITDDLSMRGSVTGTKGQAHAAELALAAGADKVIVNGIPNVIAAHKALVRSISNPSSNLSKTVNTKVQRIAVGTGAKVC